MAAVGRGMLSPSSLPLLPVRSGKKRFLVFFPKNTLTTAPRTGWSNAWMYPDLLSHHRQCKSGGNGICGHLPPW